MKELKYAILAQRLRQDIENGVYPKASRLPGENDLVDTTGYSRQTVRKAMQILEEEGLTRRVRGSGTYVEGAKSNRPVTKNIAVVMTYINEYIFPDILRGISTVLSESGYGLQLYATHNRIDNERKVLQELLEKPIDGLIVEGTKTALPSPNIELFEKITEEIPVVFLNGYYRDLKNPIYVVADDRAGGKSLCMRLLERGHTRIGGIFKMDDMQGPMRYIGYLDALLDANAPIEDGNIIWYTTENMEDVVTSFALSTLQECSAVVCYNDEVAIALAKICKEKDMEGKFEIVSFDNSTLARLSPIPFYSIELPGENIGSYAADAMIRSLNGERVSSHTLPWKKED